MSRIDWQSIIPEAAALVESYDTPVTLRQLFYRLVSRELIPNTLTAYKTLSATTAEARRESGFPALSDRTRDIHAPGHFAGPENALDALVRQYRRDRTEGQEWTIYLGVEKNGQVEQLAAWFGAHGLPVLALGGYASQSYVDQVRADVDYQARPAVLLYAGDFDASGEDIQRDFVARGACFDRVERIALTGEQVEQYDLPPLPGKSTDPRAAGFALRHGADIQVELDALDPNDLHALYAQAVGRYWDVSKYQTALERERDERARLVGLFDYLDAA